MELVLDRERLAQDLLEKQYFGFSSTDFCIDFAELVECTIRTVCKEVGENFKNFGSDPDKTDKDIEKLIDSMLERVKEPMKNAEVVARKIFAIPPGVKINVGDKNLADDEAILAKEVEDLERTYVKKCLILERYKEVKEKIEQLKPLYEKVEALLKEPIEEELFTLKKLIKTHEEMEKAVIPEEVRLQHAMEKLALGFQPQNGKV